MVVIGKAGNGKSETANSIIGENKFATDMCASSVTHVCQREDTEITGRRISVVDTPGLFDIASSNDELAKEIAKFISLTIPGPHAVLFIAKIGRITQEDQHTFDKIVEYFGESILDYCIVVFTHHDLWKIRNRGKTIRDFVTSSKEWSKITDRCSNRYIAFANNPDGPDNDKQVDELIAMVSNMTKNSNNGFYSNEAYVEATNKRLAEIDKEKRIKEEEMRLKEFARKLLEEERRLIVEERIRQDEERKRQDEERKRQLEERKRQEEEQKRQKEETARLQNIARQNEAESKRLAAEQARFKQREKKWFREEERRERRRERLEEKLMQEEFRRQEQEQARSSCTLS